MEKRAKILTEKKIRGNISKVYNQNRHFAAAPIYYHLKAEGVHYLFTPAQMDIAKERADRNPEDLVEFPTLWQRFKSLFS